MFWNKYLMAILFFLLASRLSTSCFLAARSSSRAALLSQSAPQHRFVCHHMSSSTVSEFLKNAPRLSTSNAISLGNPAGDADSIVSAIALAYIDSTFQSQQPTKRVTPIVSIRHEDLKTQRPETKYLLQLAKIDLDDLFAVDNPDLPPKTSVTLVDHNCLTLNKPEWTVTSILDHHLDEGNHMDTCEERNIAFDSSTSSALVASTCTLMVERFPTSEMFPPSLAILLLGVILLDSVNLSPKAGKVTPRDETAVDTLLSRTDWSSLDLPAEVLLPPDNGSQGKPDTSRLFDALQNQKFNPDFWNSLSLLQALKLDYKSFGIEPHGTFGVSSVLQTMPEFLSRHALLDFLSEEEGQSFFENLEMLGVMFFSVINDTRQRQMVLVGKDGQLLDNIVKSFTEDGFLQSRVLEKTSKNDLHMVCLEQGNSKASRKQVAPLLMKYFKQQVQSSL